MFALVVLSVGTAVGDPTPIPAMNTNACMDVTHFNESHGAVVYLGTQESFESCNTAAAR